MKNQEIINLTEQLLNLTKIAKEQFHKTKEIEKEGDFYGEVLPFSNEVKEIVSLWEGSVILWIQDQKAKNLTVRQIQSATEQIQTISVQAFYPRTSRKHFLNTVNSIEFVLKAVLFQVKESI